LTLKAVNSRTLIVCLTGGPCGGKTEAMKVMQSRIESKGWDVYLVPEVPTLLMQGGCQYPGEDGGPKLKLFEASLIKLQLQVEDSFKAIAASTGRKSCLIMDRGLLDVPAYLPEDHVLWDSVLADMGLNEEECSKRYDMVLHLQSSAVGHAQHYVNSETRQESADVAKVLDSRIQDNWSRVKHPNVIVVESEEAFDDKVQKGVDAVVNTLTEKDRIMTAFGVEAEW
jgi:predicted ATPase